MSSETLTPEQADKLKAILEQRVRYMFRSINCAVLLFSRVQQIDECEAWELVEKYAAERKSRT